MCRKEVQMGHSRSQIINNTACSHLSGISHSPFSAATEGVNCAVCRPLRRRWWGQSGEAVLITVVGRGLDRGAGPALLEAWTLALGT
jgi:hypothetical protein